MSPRVLLAFLPRKADARTNKGDGDRKQMGNCAKLLDGKFVIQWNHAIIAEMARKQSTGAFEWISRAFPHAHSYKSQPNSLRESAVNFVTRESGRLGKGRKFRFSLPTHNHFVTPTFSSASPPLFKSISLNYSALLFFSWSRVGAGQWREMPTDRIRIQNITHKKNWIYYKFWISW